ncbi:MAG: hydrogenase maturation nickel metallochaperone HypA [Lachnospiraceae bacterium]|nr:hydrogenase maturation nickel metallochaperone HypA [Lachnospiraceae bacterium]
MHELSVTTGLVNMVTEEGKKAGATKVTKVNLVIGKCSCLVPQILTDYFALLSEGTVAEGAEVNIKRLPGKVTCNDCHATSEIPDFRVVCPVCKSRNTTLIQGKEFYLDSLEIE